jgi:hypothetical protein
MNECYSVASGPISTYLLVCTQVWRSSQQPGGPALQPVGGGGMGPAVFLSGNFYIIGGESRFVCLLANTPVVRTYRGGNATPQFPTPLIHARLRPA